MRLRVSVVAFALACSACAQGVEVSINTLGSQPLKNYTGELIHGVRLLDVLVCPDPGTAEFSAGRIWQSAITNNISPEFPEQARLTLNRPVTFNWRNWMITAVGIGSSGLLAISTGRIVALSTQVITALAIGNVFWPQISTALRSTTPDPSEFIQSLLDPTKQMLFDSTGNCQATHMVAQFNPRLPGVVGPFHVGAPAPLVGARVSGSIRSDKSTPPVCSNGADWLGRACAGTVASPVSFEVKLYP